MRLKRAVGAGDCYIASEAAYHLLGGKASGLTPMVGKADDGKTHWWLRRRDGTILDLTGHQYDRAELKRIYSRGRGNGFLTKGPSKRAKELM